MIISQQIIMQLFFQRLWRKKEVTEKEEERTKASRGMPIEDSTINLIEPHCSVPFFEVRGASKMASLL